MRATFTTHRRAEDTRDTVTARDLVSRCHAAARLATQSKAYSHEDRQDIAAELVARVWEDCQSRRTVTSVMAIGGIVTAVPASAATMTHLYGMACNLRRTIDRDRARDDVEAARAAGDVAFIPLAPAAEPETRGTPLGARRLAVDMLSALGAPTGWGPAFTLAYASSRAAAGLESAAIAAELELSASAYRQHLVRGARALNTGHHLPHLYADALALEDGTRAARGRTPILAVDARTRPDSIPTVTTRRAAGGTRATWTADSGRCADWTLTLNRNTRARLAKAAQIQRARAAAKAPADVQRDRLAAGITGTVR